MRAIVPLVRWAEAISPPGSFVNEFIVVMQVMSQRDNFGNGFLLGAIVGGTVGGLIGAILASRNQGELPLEPDTQALDGDEEVNDRNDRRSVSRRRLDEVRMENARRSLEGKIAQLNEAIDDVRQRFEDSNP